jgi:integrase
MVTKPYPKDNEPRTMGLPQELVAQLGAYIADRRLKRGDLLFATGRAPRSPATPSAPGSGAQP